MQKNENEIAAVGLDNPKYPEMVKDLHDIVPPRYKHFISLGRKIRR
jgi:hypothetical protein